MAPTATKALVAAIALLAAACALPRAAACEVTVGDPVLLAGPGSGTLQAGAYTADQVKAHYMALPNTSFVSTAAKRVTFACVDSRNPAPYARSFGGDMAELIVGITVYLNQTGTPFSQATVDELLWGYMDGVKSFYYHTNEAKLAAVYAAVNAATGKSYVVLPEIAPAGAEGEIWLDALTSGAKQGCGHLSLLIQNPADYGLASADVPRAAIRSFFNYWWPTPLDDKRRARANFVVYQGGLTGRAVTVVQSTPDSRKACVSRRRYFGPPSAVKGSQVFAYTPEAADAFRAGALADYFAKAAKGRAGANAGGGAKFDRAAFVAGVTAAVGVQNAATLRLLAPASEVNVYAVPLTIK